MVGVTLVAMFGTAALGADVDDVAVTSLGAQGTRAEAIETDDVDLVFGERLRWEIANDWRVLTDARLTIDPLGATTWEQSRVRSLGVAFEDEGLLVAVGRHPVEYGGPRIVDGLQAVGRLGDFSLGAWGGLAPDLFTTRPMVRPGGGPILAWQRGWASWSVVGEVLSAEGGVDRAGVLALARASFDLGFEVSGRLDAQLADAEGRVGLADGAIFTRTTPGRTVRIDAFYDAFSSLRYQRTEALDPAVRRFAERADTLGVVDAVTEDLVDDSLHHLIGLSPQWRSPTDVSLELSARARYRYHIDPVNRYTRVGPAVGLLGLADDRLELVVDGYATDRDTGLAWDAGLTTFVELGRERALALDTSGRILLDPAYAGQTGWYADLFVDWLAPGNVTLVAGLSWTYEPDPLLDDVGIGAFLRAQQTFRPAKKRPVAVPVVTDADPGEPEEEDTSAG